MRRPIRRPRPQGQRLAPGNNGRRPRGCGRSRPHRRFRRGPLPRQRRPWRCRAASIRGADRCRPGGQRERAQGEQRAGQRQGMPARPRTVSCRGAVDRRVGKFGGDLHAAQGRVPDQAVDAIHGWGSFEGGRWRGVGQGSAASRGSNPGAIDCPVFAPPRFRVTCRPSARCNPHPACGEPASGWQPWTLDAVSMYRRGNPAL